MSDTEQLHDVNISAYRSNQNGSESHVVLEMFNVTYGEAVAEGTKLRLANFQQRFYHWRKHPKETGTQ